MPLEAKNVSRRFFRKIGEANWFTAVSDTDFSLPQGSLTVLMGRSGSGKTTLLNMLAGLLTPSGGQVFVDGSDLYAMGDAKLSRFRNEHIGVIPQGQTALHSLSVLENVTYPALMYHPKANAEREALDWLERFGIAHLRDARPGELSGGELRRVAIARALINRGAGRRARRRSGRREHSAGVRGAQRHRPGRRGRAHGHSRDRRRAIRRPPVPHERGEN